MATLTHANSRRLYSWWWDSHISPKNSKWLQENLSDMDMKVKAMIKLIEEDADSFARRAEMYYKKRPELMKLVEEFYRAYRALAERYDHATGALLQAHRTMAEAFPNQIPSLPDEPPEENEALTNKKGVKQFHKGNIRIGLDFQEEEEYANRMHELLDIQDDEMEEKGDIVDEVKCLQEEISHLSKENQNLKDQVTSESLRADKAEAELRSLKDALSKLESEKEAAVRQYQPSLERMSKLESEISHINELKKQNDDILMGLEGEIRRLEEENGGLNEQNTSSSVKIKRLQDEVGLYEEEKKILQQELSCLQENKMDLEEKHHGLIKQMEAVSSNVEYLRTLVKDLQDGNVELKELCKKHEDEKVLHSQNVEKISEKNAVLENSLSDVNVELEGLREKIKTLEESCESLNGKISVQISEKAVLVFQVESVAQRMEKLSDKNTFLENSLSDVNVELEGLKRKLKSLEDSYQSLSVQKSHLLAEKNALVSQVEAVSQSLENMEKRYSALEDKHSYLEKENGSILLQIVELRDLVKSEKRERESLIEASNCKLLSLENQVHTLQEQSRLRDGEFELEQYKSMNAQIENYILQRSIYDMKEKKLILSIECQKLLEKSRCAEEVISKLEQEQFFLQEKIVKLSEQNEKLWEGVHLILEALNVSQDMSDGNKYESLLQIILCEIRNTLTTISDTQNENQVLLLEKSIFATLLKQFGLEMADLKLEKDALEHESNKTIEELAVVQEKKHELLAMNEKLRLDLHSSNKNVEVWKSEKEILCQKLSDVQEAYSLLLGDNDSLLKRFYDMGKVKDALEQENTAILAEAMTLEHLYLIFKSYSAERALDSKSLVDDLHSLHEIRNSLDDKIKQMNEKMRALEVENIHHKDLIVNMEHDLKQASLQVEMRNDLLMQKDMEISQADQNLQFAEANNAQLRNEIKDLRSKEEHLASEVKKGVHNLQKSELEFAALLDDMQSAIVHATIFEEKALELLVACDSLESSALIQREMLLDEITSRASHVVELKNMLSAIETENRELHTELSAHLPLISSLWRGIASLEEITRSLMKRHASTNQENQVYEDCREPSEVHNSTVFSGVQELQKLQAKVEALQKVVADTESLLEKERFDSNANLTAAKKEIEVLKSQRRSRRRKPGSDPRLQEDGAEISHMKDETMKDIPLDHVRSSPNRNRVRSAAQDVELDDDMLALWGIAKQHDVEPHRVERSNHPSSEIVLEKELSIDRLEVPKQVTDPDDEWNRRVLESLASDAKRLSLLRRSVQELKRKIELSEISNHPPSFDFETIKAQTKEAETAIYQLIDFNNKLAKKAEDFPASPETLHGELNRQRSGNTSRRRISDRAQRGSEKIGRLELELQKIQYILLKLEEEHRYKRERAAERRRRVLLKDYLYGRRDKQRERKAPFCACMRASTKSD